MTLSSRYIDWKRPGRARQDPQKGQGARKKKSSLATISWRWFATGIRTSFSVRRRPSTSSSVSLPMAPIVCISPFFDDCGQSRSWEGMTRLQPTRSAFSVSTTSNCLKCASDKFATQVTSVHGRGGTDMGTLAPRTRCGTTAEGSSPRPRKVRESGGCEWAR